MDLSEGESFFTEMKIFFAENFVNVQFLVPFSTFDVQTPQNLLRSTDTSEEQ